MLYAAGTGAPEAALAVSRAHARAGRTLIVVDDADRASAEVRAALRGLVPALGGVPSWCSPGLQAAALAGSNRRNRSCSSRSTPAACGRSPPSTRPPTARRDPGRDVLATSRGVARRVHEAASEWARREATRRVDAVAGPHGGRPQRDAHARGRAGRSVVELQSVRERAGRVARDQTTTGAADLPVQGPRDVRRRGRRVLLRARAARRRAGRAPRRRAAARDRGPVGSGKSSVCGPGCCPRSPAASCPEARTGRRR